MVISISGSAFLCVKPWVAVSNWHHEPLIELSSRTFSPQPIHLLFPSWFADATLFQLSKLFLIATWMACIHCISCFLFFNVVVVVGRGLEIEAQGDVGIDLVGEVAPAEGGT